MELVFSTPKSLKSLELRHDAARTALKTMFRFVVCPFPAGEFVPVIEERRLHPSLHPHHVC